MTQEGSQKGVPSKFILGPTWSRISQAKGHKCWCENGGRAVGQVGVGEGGCGRTGTVGSWYWAEASGGGQFLPRGQEALAILCPGLGRV